MGALVIRALIFGVYVRAPDFWKLPYAEQGSAAQAHPFKIKPEYNVVDLMDEMEQVLNVGSGNLTLEKTPLIWDHGGLRFQMWKLSSPLADGSWLHSGRAKLENEAPVFTFLTHDT